jgi:hypothetical protein
LNRQEIWDRRKGVMKKMKIRMTIKIRYGLLFLLLSVPGHSLVMAEEGMWIPLLLEKYQIGAMKEEGLELDAEAIFSINNDCLKDAVVRFGGGCTGEVISDDGLVLTNHHCGEGYVQSHSSVEHDYLTDGYWAMSREEELPNEGISVAFLRFMKDVTGEVNEGVEQGMDPGEKQRKRELNQGRIIREATDTTQLEVQVAPFYYGNAYYLFIYEVFRDVRLVGAPPISIGNFGGDTDNWIWPRHTGDFSLFRIYADQENKPADYSPSNQPYKSRGHLEINAGGVHGGDFTMVIGYPARTSRYLRSEAVDYMLAKALPLKIALRTCRLEIMDRYMKESDVVRIQYAHKYRGVSNAWKKWQGVVLGLEKNNVVEKKRELEMKFSRWLEDDGIRQMRYNCLAVEFPDLYRERLNLSLATDMQAEAVMVIEVFREAEWLLEMMATGRATAALQAHAAQFFKNYYMPVDREVYAAMMKAYREEMPEQYYPLFFGEVDKRFGGDFSRYAEFLYRKSLLTGEEGVSKLISLYDKDPSGAVRKLKKDPLATCCFQFGELYTTLVDPLVHAFNVREEKLYGEYMAGLLEMSGEQVLYPDANGTMRISYGKVEGYTPRDGVQYHWYTTMDGIMEKIRGGSSDYRVPERLASIYETGDFGRYGSDGALPVCFIASNHTSGGNSGSPVLDARGRLIGLNFDREWEGTMSDLWFDPELCRNIAVDIRYVLFLIDRYAGAGYLLDEMNITW